MSKKTIRYVRSMLAASVMLAATFAGVASLNGQAQSAQAAPNALPPIPAGLPSYFGYGLFNGSMSDMHSGVPYNYRYQYLAGGVTGGGWQSWQGDGRYAASYVSASRQAGYIPGFVYYNILQSSPSYDEYNNLQNASTMLAYYRDFKALLQQSAGSGAVFINVEPDLDGVMMQHSSNTDDDASGQPAKVGSTGMLELAGIADNFRGYWQALAHLRDLYAPNVILGQDLSIWGADYDLTIALRNNPNYNWQAHADRTAAYHTSFGPGYDLNFFSPLDRDAAFYEITYGSNRWWDATDQREPKFSTIGAWLGRIDNTMSKRALMWQVPNGNRVYRSENNTDGHYQDNRPEYFLNPTNGRSHMTLWANYGVIGIMFGAGAGGQSHYFDSKRDGITNPAPINGNDQVAQYADDDGGYIRVQSAAYYSGGPLPLPGGSGSTPTPSPVRTNTPAPTSTPGARVLVGHVTWHGRPAQPDVRQQLPITLTLKLGATEVNYPVQTTDASGFFTVSVGGLANGIYDWRVKGPKFLANSGTVNVVSVSRTNFEGGLLLTGDCDNNNLVNMFDYNILKNSMGRTPGDPGYDDRADLSGDSIINGVDFTLLQANIGTGGAPPTAP
jgi:hypothetical protein